jgi:RHS repeat-associated protein
VFSSQRGYDAASNVTAVTTTLAAGTGGTDNQAFCYDEQNRLVWAGASGTPSCGGTLTPGSLTSASYTQTFVYDTLDRLTSGSLGSYTYGDSAHLHAVTSSGSSPTSIGYTGQRADSATGLDYYHARYYDPVAGQFASADTMADGLNRYGYVRGNPTTATDPSGHRMVSQDEYGCGNCDFYVDNVTVVHEGCANPDLGCSYANATRAVVGSGNLQQKGTDNTPTVYSYGSKQNGALLTGFKGKSSDNFIKAMEDLRNMWQRFLDADSQYGSLAIDIASLIGAFATQVGQCLLTEGVACHLADGDELQQLKDEYDANLTGIEQLAVTVAQESVDNYNHSIAALKGAASKGQTVWYMQMMWLGHNASRYSQVLGGTSFFTGWGDQPPPDALLAIGESMRAQCAEYPSSPWGNSPGVNASQDSTYVGPCI